MTSRTRISDDFSFVFWGGKEIKQRRTKKKMSTYHAFDMGQAKWHGATLNLRSLYKIAVATTNPSVAWGEDGTIKRILARLKDRDRAFNHTEFADNFTRYPDGYYVTSYGAALALHTMVSGACTHVKHAVQYFYIAFGSDYFNLQREFMLKEREENDDDE